MVTAALRILLLYRRKGATAFAELGVVLTTLLTEGRSITTLWRKHQAAACLIYSLLFFSSLFSSFSLFISLRFGIVAMPFFEHLWPAGSIFATLLLPFGLAMGARLVGWARDRRLLGPAVRWLFPADLVSPPPLAVKDDALLAAVEKVGRTAADLKAAIDDRNMLLQQLMDDRRELLQEMRQFRFMMTGNITPLAI